MLYIRYVLHLMCYIFNSLFMLHGLICMCVCDFMNVVYFCGNCADLIVCSTCCMLSVFGHTISF